VYLTSFWPVAFIVFSSTRYKCMPNMKNLHVLAKNMVNVEVWDQINTPPKIRLDRRGKKQKCFVPPYSLIYFMMKKWEYYWKRKQLKIETSEPSKSAHSETSNTNKSVIYSFIAPEKERSCDVTIGIAYQTRKS